MNREIALFIVLAIGALALFAAWRGWQSKVAKFSHLPALPQASALTGELIAGFEVMYMATTPSAEPLERIALKPLAFRAKARLEVRTDGLGLFLTGEGDCAIERTQIVGVGVATWTIDKVVDSEGLVFIRWMWGETTVDSYLRVVDHSRDDVISALEMVRNGKGESVSGH